MIRVTLGLCIAVYCMSLLLLFELYSVQCTDMAGRPCVAFDPSFSFLNHISCEQFLEILVVIKLHTCIPHILPFACISWDILAHVCTHMHTCTHTHTHTRARMHAHTAN